MVPFPPTPPRVRSGWRVGLLVFSLGMLVAAGFMMAPLLWPNRDAALRLPDDPASPARGATRPRHTTTTSFTRHASFLAAEIDPVAQLTATNLTAITGPARPVDALTNILRGVAGSGIRLAGSNCITRTNKELAVFTALRASFNQPIPKEVKALALDITRDCKTDAERAKAIYDWITGHITYDWKVWADIVAGANTYTQPQDPLSVIQRGTGVCAGYAWLFDALTTSVGIDASFVIGDVRGYRGTTDDSLISPYLHAWNCVQIDGQTYLLDSTWGARQDGESATDYLARRNYYFQTPPNQIIFDHFPENPSLQLLANPIGTDAFQSLPNLKPTFFTDGLRLGNAFNDAISTSAGTPTGVTLAVPDGILLAATLSINGQDISANNLLIRQNGIRNDVVIGPLPAGKYILRLYAKNAANAGPYDCAADYAVTVSSP